MPSPARRKAVKTLSREEQRFIERYVREGATEDKIAIAERMAYLKSGSGTRILGRIHVQEEIKRRMEPVRLEQMRQQMLSDAVSQVTANLQEERDKLRAEMDKLLAVPQMKVDESVLEHELMRLVVGLDQNEHPQVKLAAIQAAFVVKGILESGRSKRVAPTDDPDRAMGPGIYATMRSKMLTEGATLLGDPQPPAEEPGVFDLIPQETPPAAPASGAPEPGEEIEPITLEPIKKKAPKVRNAGREVITVEIG